MPKGAKLGSKTGRFISAVADTSVGRSQKDIRRHCGRFLAPSAVRVVTTVFSTANVCWESRWSVMRGRVVSRCVGAWLFGKLESPDFLVQCQTSLTNCGPF